MSRRKGLSKEEKQIKLLQLLQEKKDVFLLKDLEKIAPKEKGIVSQSVKEVLQSLVDDNLVDSEKIGSSTYFWSFPSKAFNIKTRTIEELNRKIDESKKKIISLDAEIKSIGVSGEELDMRSKELKMLKAYNEERNEVMAKLKSLEGFDLETIQKEVNDSKEAINRWTDNVFAVKSWCKQKCSLEESEINKQFGISEDFDYPNF